MSMYRNDEGHKQSPIRVAQRIECSVMMVGRGRQYAPHTREIMVEDVGNASTGDRIPRHTSITIMVSRRKGSGGVVLRMGSRGGIRARSADKDNEVHKFRACEFVKVVVSGGKVKELCSQLVQSTMAEGGRKLRVEKEEKGRMTRSQGNRRSQEADRM